MAKHPTTEAAPTGEMEKIVEAGMANKNKLSLEPTAPKQLGRFSVIRELGRGGMGTVYLGYDPQLERQVAIKLIQSQHNGKQTYAQRFEREAKIIASINHAHIVQIYDRGDDPEYGNFIVLEYVDGENAYEWVRRNGPLSVTLACKILKATAEALYETNKEGIIHRDIKPGNILLGKNGSIKLTDLGIAKQARNVGCQQLTGNQSPGTPEYMAPEQKKSLPLDIRADIYSLGKTFIYLLTGEPDLNFLLEKFKLVKTKADQRLLNALLPIIHKMTEVDREDRYCSPKELLKDVNQALKSPLRIRIQITLVAIILCSVFALFGGSLFKPDRGHTKALSQPGWKPHSTPIRSNEPKEPDILELLKFIKENRKNSQDLWTSPPVIIMVLPMEFDPDISATQKKHFSRIPLASTIKEFTNRPVVERESLTYLLKEYNLEAADLTDPEARLRLGKMLPASILLESVVYPIQTKLVLSTKIVNIETSEILEFVEVKSTVTEPNTVHSLYQSMASKLASSIHKNLTLQGKIISVNQDLAEINLGQYHGVKKGMRFQIRNTTKTARGRIKAGPDILGQGIVENIKKYNASLKIEETPEQAKPGMLILENKLQPKNRYFKPQSQRTQRRN